MIGLFLRPGNSAGPFLLCYYDLGIQGGEGVYICGIFVAGKGSKGGGLIIKDEYRRYI